MWNRSNHPMGLTRVHRRERSRFPYVRRAACAQNQIRFGAISIAPSADSSSLKAIWTLLSMRICAGRIATVSRLLVFLSQSSDFARHDQ